MVMAMAATNHVLDHLCANASSDLAQYLMRLHLFGFGCL